MINPTPERIEAILNEPAQFAVPVYQRDYIWGKDEASEFYEDLESHLDAKDASGLFLGTLIFDMSTIEAPKKKIRVVDGQQRITTILLFLIACRTVAKNINSNLAHKIHEKIAFADSTTAESLGCRLLSSEKIRDVFEDIALNYDWDGTFPTKLGLKQVKRQVKRIKPI